MRRQNPVDTRDRHGAVGAFADFRQYRQVGAILAFVVLFKLPTRWPA